jgi:hypothetical protein
MDGLQMNPILHRIEAMAANKDCRTLDVHVESADGETWHLKITYSWQDNFVRPADTYVSSHVTQIKAKHYDIDAWISEVAQVGAAPDYTSDADGERIWFDTRPTRWSRSQTHA